MCLIPFFIIYQRTRVNRLHTRRRRIFLSFSSIIFNNSATPITIIVIIGSVHRRRDFVSRAFIRSFSSLAGGRSRIKISVFPSGGAVHEVIRDIRRSIYQPRAFIKIPCIPTSGCRLHTFTRASLTILPPLRDFRRAFCPRNILFKIRPVSIRRGLLRGWTCHTRSHTAGTTSLRALYWSAGDSASTGATTAATLKRGNCCRGVPRDLT